MRRQAFAVATALTCTAIILAGSLLIFAGDAQAQRFSFFDPERIFMLGDADLDGRLSLDEFLELYRSSPRMKNAAATIKPLFRRLDTDRDGFLSLLEYRKAFPGRPGGANAKPDSAKEKLPGVGNVGASAIEGAHIALEQEKFFEAKISLVPTLRVGTRAKASLNATEDLKVLKILQVGRASRPTTSTRSGAVGEVREPHG
jgi:hypothetical protein